MCICRRDESNINYLKRKVKDYEDGVDYLISFLEESKKFPHPPNLQVGVIIYLRNLRNKV